MNLGSLLDARTIYLIQLPILLLLAVLFVSLWQQRIGGRQAGLWALGFTTVALNLLLANLREVLPPFISTFIGFACGQIGATAIAWGLFLEAGRRFPLRPVIALIGVIQIAQGYFLFADPDMRVRVMLGGFSHFVLCILGVAVLAAEWRSYRRAPARFTILWLGLIALGHGSRVVGAALSKGADFAGAQQQASFSFALSMAIALIATLGLGIGLMWLRMTEWYRATAAAKEAAETAREAAEVAAQAKSRFLASVSHDIRTPMNAIIGLSRLLGRTPLNERQSIHVSRIGTAAGTLLELVEGVLDAARIEAGTMNVEVRNFDLADVLARVDTIARVQADAKGLALEVVPAPDVPLSLHGDPVRLGQILLNIVGNAVKFTESGEVALSVAVMKRDGDAVDLRFIVHDTGPGIAPKDLADIFEPFRQADHRSPKGGTGLGLAIAAQLVQLMGGRIDVQSVLGLGATFTVDVSFRVAAAPATPIEASMAPRFEGVRVLVAEDDEINREVAAEILQEAGATVEMVTTGKAAVERVLANAAAYDIVLMDIRMPEMDGLTATARIRAVQGRDALPIIAVTAHAFDDERDACLAAGMNEFVTKPIEPSRLLTALARCLPARVSFVPTGARPGIKALPSAIPGFDIAAAVNRFCGNESVVQRLLSTFSTRCGNAGASLRAAVGEGRLDDARSLVHGFRSAAATLGAVGLSQRAERLEAALSTDNRAVVPEAVAALTLEMEAAAGALRAHGFQ